MSEKDEVLRGSRANLPLAPPAFNLALSIRSGAMTILPDDTPARRKKGTGLTPFPISRAPQVRPLYERSRSRPGA